jgi:hypothetical protein
MSLKNILKKTLTRATQAVKKLGAFSAGMFVGVCYGSAVGAVTAYMMLLVM